jgi:hypothetical protein
MALPAMLFERLWLPDPIYSFFSIDSKKAWEMLPESGSNYFVDGKTPYTDFTSFWSVPTDQRTAALQSTLPRLLARVRELKPLIDIGAIGFYPWEPLLLKKAGEMREACNRLAKSNIVNSLTQKFLQDNYSLGPRLGAMGVKFSTPPPGSQFKAGDPLWLVEKRPILLLGFLNAAYSHETSAAFLPEKTGDRIVYEFIRSGGNVDGTSFSITSKIELPRFSRAVWADIVSIRKSSSALAELRSIVRDAGGVSEEKSLPAIRDRLEKASGKLKEDSSLLKATQGSLVDVAINTSITGVGGYIVAGLDASLIATLGAGVATLICSYCRAHWDRKRKSAREAAELLINVSEGTKL